MVRSLVLIGLVGCQRGADRPFPEAFRFGTATAGFQVEAGCPTLPPEGCEDRGSDWYQWVTDPALVADRGLFLSGDPVSAGPGMWETFEDDAAQMQTDGFDALRLGLEWSRLFPDGAAFDADSVDALDAHVDAAARDRYHAMFAALAARDLHPMVTVNHYTLPLWIHDGKACHADPDACEADGWVDAARIVPQIARYAGWVAREYGGEVDEWATLNEPLAIPVSGFLAPSADRSNPPGLVQDGARAIATIAAQIEGHAAMADAIRAEDTEDADGDGTATSVGVVMSMTWIEPRDPSKEDDLRAAAHMDHVYHGLFLDGLTAGSWDDDLDGTFDRTRPELADRLDWVGVNYYAKTTVGGISFSLVPEAPVFDFVPVIDWVPYGEGVGPVLARATAAGLPAVITENGYPSEDVALRSASLEENLAAVQAEIADGVDVRGFYYWTYVDNYEWNHGFGLRFGLYALDPDTKARSPRTELLSAYQAVITRWGFDD